MSTAIIQHRYNLRSSAKRALNQPVKIIKEKEPIIKISIFVYLLNMIAYLFEICTPDIYKNILKRQSEQDANDMQQDQEKEYEDKEDKDKEDEVVEQMELLSHTNICGLVSLIKR